MGPYEADIFLIRERARSLRRQKEEDMSKKEKKEALEYLLDVVRRHEGEWNVNRMIGEVVVKFGQRRETVEGYLRDLQVARRVTVKGEMVYLDVSETVKPVSVEEKK